MDLKKKLQSINLESGYERLSSEKLSSIFGGQLALGSCNVTASSSGCDRTAVCNCPDPDKDGPIKPKEDCFTP